MFEISRNQMKLFAIFLVSLSVVLGLPAEQLSDEPDFCHKLDCPKFTIVKTFKDYELRNYKPSVWVATKMTKMDYSDQDRKNQFNKLFYYISGNNKQGMKIPMTTPVLETVLHGQGPDCESTFTMHFIIPFDLQKSPPVPTDGEVFITTLPVMNVFVRSFGGFLNGTDIQNNLIQLADDIEASNSTKYISNPFYYAGYDNPFQILHRHNEVWLQAQ